MLEAYLNDPGQRIDPAVEAALPADWQRFYDGIGGGHECRRQPRHRHPILALRRLGLAAATASAAAGRGRELRGRVHVW